MNTMRSKPSLYSMADFLQSLACVGARSLLTILIVGASLLTACGSSSNTATTASESVSASSTGMVALLAQWTDAGEDVDRQAELLDRLVDLAYQADWMEQLRAYELSEEAFVKLPAKERDELRQVYLDRSGALKSLANAAIAEMDASRASGDRFWADELRIAVERVAQANDNENVVLIGRIVAQSIARRVHPKG